MGHSEGVAEVLDGESLLLLRGLQEGDGCLLGHQAAGCEVVDLEPLLQELGVARRTFVTEDAVRHRLQRHRAQSVAAGDGGRRQVDAAVRDVRDGSGGVGQVVHVDELEAELLGHHAHLAVGEGSRPVPGRASRGPRRAARSRAGGCCRSRIRSRSSVFARRASSGVAMASEARRASSRCRPTMASSVSSVMPRVGFTGGKPERDVQRDCAAPGELDLERGARVRSLGRQQGREIDVEGARDRLQRADPGLALAVLDERELAAGDADALAELVEGEPALAAEMANPMAEGGEVRAALLHDLRIAKLFQFCNGAFAASGGQKCVNLK